VEITDIEIFSIDGSPGGGWNPVLVRLNTDEGISGIGEVALAYGVGAAAGVRMVEGLARRLLLGADPFRIEQLWDRMFRGTFWGQGGGPVVYGGMSAIDEALWDIKGKALGVPVYELLGGRCHDRLRVYANGWYHGLVEPEQYAEGALKVQEDGYTATKFDPFAVAPDGTEGGVGRVLERERAQIAWQRVRAVREATGPDFDILIEVHGNLGTTEAIRMGQRLEQFEPFFYEEPVDAMNVDSMKKVAENVDIPIAAGERLYTRYGFRQYVEKQAVDILQPDVGLAGGITETKKIAAHAETYSLHVQPHNCASPVATAASVQVDACITNFIIQEVFPYRGEETTRIVQETLESHIQDGYLPVPAAPGLGVRMDDEVVEKYRCGRVTK
jgi:galactonate dehydratase